MSTSRRPSPKRADVLDGELITDALAVAAGSSRGERETPASRETRDRRRIASFRRQLRRFLEEIPGDASVAEIRESLESAP